MMTQEEKNGLMGKDCLEMKNCCGNCRLFIPRGIKTDDGKSKLGWCDNYAGVPIKSNYHCSPSGFIPKQDFEETKGE